MARNQAIVSGGNHKEGETKLLTAVATSRVPGAALLCAANEAANALVVSSRLSFDLG